MSPLIVAERDDPLVAVAEKGMDAFATGEGFFLVNAFPCLKYLPSWFPGSGFKRIASDGYQNSMGMYKKPYEMAKEKSVSIYIVEYHLQQVLPMKLRSEVGHFNLQCSANSWNHTRLAIRLSMTRV